MAELSEAKRLFDALLSRAARVCILSGAGMNKVHEILDSSDMIIGTCDCLLFREQLLKKAELNK
jgi:hypothetical protein